MASLDQPSSFVDNGNQKTEKEDHCLMVRAIRGGDKCTLKKFIDEHSRTPRLLSALSRQSNSGQYPLHYTEKDMSVNESDDGRAIIVGMILDGLMPNEILNYLMLRNTESDQTALQTAAKSDEVDVVRVILRRLKSKEIETLLNCKDRWKQTVYNYKLSEACRKVIEDFNVVGTVCPFDEEPELDEAQDFVEVYKADDLIAWLPDSDLGGDGISSKSDKFMAATSSPSSDENVDCKYLTMEEAIKHFDQLVNHVRSMKAIDVILRLRNQEGMTIVHVLAKQRRYDLIDQLLGAVSLIFDADSKWKLIKAKCNHSKTSLHYAVIAGCRETVRTLLDHSGVHKTMILPEKDKEGKSVLHIAARLRKTDILHNLICIVDFPMRQHLITDACNKSKTVLHYAAANNNSSFSILVNHMENKSDLLFHKDADSFTILHLIANNRYVEAVLIDSLLSEVPNFTTKWNLLTSTCMIGRTSLHYAAANNNLEKVKVLIRHCGGRELDVMNITDDVDEDATDNCYGVVNDFFSLVRRTYWQTSETPPTALIFYTRLDDHPTKKREGADDEMEKMKATLEFCGITPKIFPDFEDHQLIEEIRKAQREGRGQISAFLVIIMSHGEEGWMVDKNLTQFRLQTVLDTICESNGGLDFVPKVLMLQSCRDWDSSLPGTDGGLDAAETAPLIGKKCEPGGLEQYNIRAHDTCLIHSTLAGRPSIRQMMANKFWKVVCKRRNRTADLTDIIMYVNQEMGHGQRLELRTSFSRHLKLQHDVNGSLIDRLKALVKFK